MLAPAQHTRYKLRPLIKWTGGKYDEFGEFAHLVPAFNNYYEPFTGGGGVFFALQPQGLAFLNDKSADLIRFYRLLKDAAFQAQLYIYADAWEATTQLGRQLCVDLQDAFKQFLSDGLSAADLKTTISNYIHRLDDANFDPLFSQTFIVDVEAFKTALIASLYDKCSRIKKIQQKEGRRFEPAELPDHLETGVKSGLYLYLRGLTNLFAAGKLTLSDEKAAANWYFVREFCYASMFRFNRNGHFNIPYGGIAYNKKNFRAKVDIICSEATREVLKSTFFYNLDFEAFLNEAQPQADDFVFIDPPYDSEFSEYDQNAFTQADQQRLRDAIARCPAKCMVVIKETPFIRELYTTPAFTIVDFDKTYTYNVRGRNNRGTKHLVIINYQL